MYKNIMSEALFDKESWKRALSPAIRVLGYTAAVYLVMYIIIILPIYLLVQAGVPDALWEVYAAPLYTILMVFFFILILFKVIDEERPGQVQLDMA